MNGATNRKFWNFLEYQFKGNCLIVNYINYTIEQLPKLPTATSLNNNIMFNSDKALVGVEKQDGS